MKNISKKKDIICFKPEILDNLPKQYQKKFRIIYSVISDQTDILGDKKNNYFYKEELKILFEYNEKQHDNRILLGKNFFSYFIDIISSKDIKKIYQLLLFHPNFI